MSQPNGKKIVVDKEGKRWLVDDQYVQDDLDKGFKLETPEETKRETYKKELGGLGGQAEAFGMGAARALTFGGSDWLATKGFGEDPERIKALEEENPIASTAGNIAGTVGGAVLGGPVAWAGRAGLAARTAVAAGESGLLRTIAAHAAQGAVESGLWGLGNAISESAINKDQELTAEQLLSHGAMSALLGGAIGGGLGLAGAGVRGGINFFKPAVKEVEPTLADILNSSASAERSAAEEFPSTAVRGPRKPTPFEPVTPFPKQRGEGRPGVAEWDSLNTQGAPVEFPEVKALPRGQIETPSPFGPIPTPRPGIKSEWGGGQIAEGTANARGLAVRPKEPEVPWNTPPKETPQLESPLNAVQEGVGEQSPFKKEIRHFANIRIVKAMSHFAKDWRRILNNDQIDELGEAAIQHGIVTPGSSIKEIAEKAAAAQEEQGAKLGEVYQTLDQVSTPQQLINPQRIAEKIEALAKPLEKRPAMAPIMNQLKAEAEKFRGLGDKMSFADAWQNKRDYDKLILWDNPNYKNKEFTYKLRTLIAKEIESSADAVVNSEARRAAGSNYSQFVENFRKTNKLYGLFKQMSDMSSNEYVMRDIKNRFVSGSDYLAGGAGMIHGGFGLGAALAVGNKIARQYGNQFVGGTLHKLLENGSLDKISALVDSQKGKYGSLISKVADSFKDTVEEKLNQSPGSFGPFSALLSNAAAKGADELLATHVHLYETDPQYRQAAAANGLADEHPGAMPFYQNKIDLLNSLNKRIEDHNTKVDAQLNAFLNSKSLAPPLNDGNITQRIKTFQANLDRIKQLAANPDAMANSVMPNQNLQEAAPQTALQTLAKAQQAIQFLNAKAPKDPAASPFEALDRGWQPTKQQMLQFERYQNAALNPQVVLSELASGYVSPETVETLRTLYPKLLADMQQRVLAQMGTTKKVLTFQQRKALSTLVGTPVGIDPPSSDMIFQKLHQRSENEEKEKARQMAKTGTLSKGFATESQRVEGGQ